MLPTLKRGLFADPDQSPMACRARTMNPEFLTAFRLFDRNGDGTIDILELSNALGEVKLSVESGVQQPLFPQPFKPNTICALAGRFAGGTHLNGEQFCCLLEYMNTLKRIFQEVDVNRSGSIEFDEFAQALVLSGCTLNPNAAKNVFQTYDENGNGVMEFDEFTQFRLEFDVYFLAWHQCCTVKGMTMMAPAELLGVLEQVQKDLEPYGNVFNAYAAQSAAAALGMQGLMLTSAILSQQRAFRVETLERLIIRFGAPPNPSITFEQFIDMMNFLKAVAQKFREVDVNGDGRLNFSEILAVFQSLGIHFDLALVSEIARSYDRDNSNHIEFDEFVQMIADWQEWAGLTPPAGLGYWGANELQQLFGIVRTRYHFMGGAVEMYRPYSLPMCRQLVARFGTLRPGELYPTHLNHLELMKLNASVTMWQLRFRQINMANFLVDGSISTQQLQILLASAGINLNPMALQKVAWNFDIDQNGGIEFDEFLQLILELELFSSAFAAHRLQTTGLAAGPVPMDESGFIALAFSVPRH